MKLQTIFSVLTSLVIAAWASTIADVLADLHIKTTALTHVLNAFPDTNSGLLAAMDIHNKVFNLISSIENATSIVNDVSKPISNTDANRVVTEVQALEPSILHCLGAVISKKPNFLALPVPAGRAAAQVKQDLNTLSAVVLKLEAALIASVPANLVPGGKPVKESIDTAFANAIAAYT